MAQEIARLAEASAAPAPDGADRVNILVVDDRPENLLAMEALLAMLGQNVVSARSGAEALRQALAMDFAVILLDVSMPGLDGFETAALIRERRRSRNTPIIFLTAALKNEAQVFRGYAAGAVDYLIKPVVPDILRSKVLVFVELARKNAELCRLNERLELRTAELAAANKELEAFSYSVSHDLRAPLRGIDGFSSMLLKLYGGQLDERGRELLARLQGSGERMSRLIDDLLKLSRASSKGIRLESVDLGFLARSSLQRMSLAEPRRHAVFLVSPGLRAEGDAGLLSILLENLLSNAWKFTSKRPETRIEFGSERQSGAEVFFVRDNGAGFDMAHAGKLFTPFQRLHAVSQFPGTGIGLATAQRIVVRHGGRIWAQAEPGKGATLFFTLGTPGRG